MLGNKLFIKIYVVECHVIALSYWRFASVSTEILDDRERSVRHVAIRSSTSALFPSVFITFLRLKEFLSTCYRLLNVSY